MMTEFFNDNVQSWIRVLSVNRDPHPMRDYIVKLLEAGVRGAQTQIDLNEEYAEIKRDGVPSPLRENLEPFDFEAEAETWRERKSKYEQALKVVRIS